MTKHKKPAGALLLAAVAVVGSLVTATAPAGATTTTAASCQPLSAPFRINVGSTVLALKCSGTHALDGQPGGAYQAGDWSGVIYYGTVGKHDFCPGDRGDLGGLSVRSVTLHATTSPLC